MKNNIHPCLVNSKFPLVKSFVSFVLLAICLLSGVFSHAQSGNIYTMAGNGTAGFGGDGGPATSAQLNNPTDIFKDAAGNYYIADRNNNRVRKINTAGTISTIAGTGTAGYTGDGGSALVATLRHPNGVAVDGAGNIYIADQGNNVIRKINTAGTISTIAGTGTAGFSGDGGAATLARLNDPEAVAVDLGGNVYIADNNNSRIRMINTSGTISTLAGGGGTGFTVDGVAATSVSLCNMRDVSVDNSGNVYFTNQGCFHILRISPSGLLYNVAGYAAASYSGDCGPADSADIEGPYGVYPDNTGNVYLCPRGNLRVRKVNTLNYIITVAGHGVAGYTGDGGPALSATVSSTITGIYADPTGNVYFADAGNNVIRTFTSSDFSDTTSLPICAGGVDTLHDTAGYGVWTSSNTGVAIIGSSSGILTGVSSGTAIITFTNVTCPALFLVNVLESAIATPTGGMVCIGSTITATDTATGGTWSSSDASIAGIGSTTGVISGVSVGTAVITYLLPTGCYATTVVTVNPLPTAILGTLSVCAGLTTSLSDALGGGTWSSGTTSVATVGSATGIVTGGSVATTSTSTITYTSAVGCTIAADVTVNPAPTAILGTLSICVSGTTTLTDATAGGTWSSSATGVATIGSLSGLVTGGSVVTASTTTITYTSVTGCYITAVLTVNPLPTAILGTLTVCAGATTTLSDASAGGTWVSGSTGVATVGSLTGIVTGGAVLTASTATITYSTGVGCSITADVTVNPIPTPILGTLTVCVGLTTPLSDVTAGGTWGSSGTATVSATGVVTGVSAGTGTITYTSGSTGCFTTAVVTVNPLPTAILGTLEVCAGGTVTLSDAIAGGTWSTTSTAIATIGSTTGVVTGGAVVLTSTTTVVYTLGTGCTITAILTVDPLPTAILGTLTVCAGQTTTLTDATTGGTWSSGATGVATVGASTGVVTGGAIATTSTATITYTLPTGCYITAVVTVQSAPAAISGALTVCAGLTTTLTDIDGGGTWSSSDGTVATIGSSSGIVTGGAVGATSTATITYSTGVGCVAMAVVTVYPAPGAITGDLVICGNSTGALTDVITGGTWLSSSPADLAVGLSTGALTSGGVLVMTTVTITYTLASGCSITTIVTVNPRPDLITGPLNICVGSTFALSDATTGGTWSSVAPGIGSISASGAITGVSTGTATISYTLPTGCARSVIVTVDPLPGAITGTLVVCAGSTTALSDSPTGGTWSSNNTAVATVDATTGVVTGAGVVLTGTATISYIIGAAGCYATAVVTVNPVPFAISGSNVVCVGYSVTLSDASPAGTWSSTNPGVGSISAGGVVTGISSGTTTISYTFSTGCAAAMVVTVDPSPGTISGLTTVCAGATITLSDTPAGGTWSSNNTGVATVGLSTGVVTGQGVGVASTATISYIIGSAGCYASVVITVDPLPAVISGANFVCVGSTIALSDATAGGTWSSAGTGIAAVGATGVVTGNSAGVTTITYQLGTGCYVTVPMTVNALPGAISGPNNLCPGTSVTLTDATPGGTWSSSNTGIATVGLLTGVVTGVAGGVVNIIYTTGAGCSGSYSVTVNANPVPVITPLGDTTFCPGGFVVLTANVAAGLTYQWYLGGAPIPGAVTSSYEATAGGFYTVKETNASGCSAFSTPMLVTIDVPVATISFLGTTIICAGTTVTLNANTGTGFSYQWLQDGGTIAGATSSAYGASVAGDYQVIVTNATGCSATSAVVSISINPSPTANVTLSGPTSFCVGGSVLLTANYDPDYTYQWYNAAGAIPGAVGQSYTASATDGYYVIITNSYGCSTTSVIVNVVANALPNVSITASGPTIFCAGGSVTLSAAAIVGGIYQWYLGGAPITGATNSSYLATVGGGYRVQVTDPATGCSAETLADTTVTVVNSPVIIPITPSSFCWGSSSLLSTSVSGASGTVTYQWFRNGVLIPGATSAIYNATIPGDYTCQITIPGSCTVATLSVPVTEYPLPDPIVYFTGAIFYTGNYYVTYQWYKNAVAIAGATSMSTPGTGNGDYKVAVTDTNGCQSFSDVYVYTGGTSGVQSVNKGSVEIYPNPASDELIIDMNPGAYATFTVTNNLGQEVMMQQLIKTQTKVNIVNLPAGIYYITFRGDNGTEVRKFVKI